MPRAARAPGWKRLWWHSYRIGFRWVVRDAIRGWPAGKVGFARLLVPLDPWRYYELGRAADEEFGGRCLDVSSPKLLPSLLQAERRGSWSCIDLLESEIEAWRGVDPTLELAVHDATALPFPDEAFDCCACISVLEHIGSGKDDVALSEMWRVLRPGGVLVLTTDVATESRNVFTEAALYGEASGRANDDGVFFKHEYSPSELDRLLSACPWLVEHREYAAQRKPAVERRFYDHAPWSYAYGPMLRFVCPGNVVVSESASLIDERGRGVVYLRLRKPVESAA